MSAVKKKATAKAAVKFKDLKAKKNPKGGPIYMLKSGVAKLNPPPLPP